MNILTSASLNNIVYPDKYLLRQNYPNPFNPATTIHYSIPSNVKDLTSEVKLVVYNSLGKKLVVLVQEKQNVGSYEVEFDGSNLPSGLYFYSLFLDNNLFETKKMLLIK